MSHSIGVIRPAQRTIIVTRFQRLMEILIRLPRPSLRSAWAGVLRPFRAYAQSFAIAAVVLNGYILSSMREMQANAPNPTNNSLDRP